MKTVKIQKDKMIDIKTNPLFFLKKDSQNGVNS